MLFVSAWFFYTFYLRVVLSLCLDLNSDDEEGSVTNIHISTSGLNSDSLFFFKCLLFYILFIIQSMRAVFGCFFFVMCIYCSM